MKKKYLLYLLFYFVSSSVFGQSSDLQVTFSTPLPICKSGDCTNITATIPALGQTTGYNNGLPIPPQTYSPDFLTTWDGIFGHKIDAVGDDVWSPVFNLPFNFSFYGVTYNKLIIGTNGVVSFDIANAGGACPWAFTGTIPSTTFPIRNAIYCVYQDTDIREFLPANPTVAVLDPSIQNVNFYILNTGPYAAPNRVFVANWNELPQYNCQNGVGLQTSQIVLHEGTNVIEFNIKKRSCCSGWNSGSGVIGTQNAAGTQASFPAGFNTSCWNSTNISFQSTPTGTAVPRTLKWEKGGVPVGSVNQNPLNVCVTGPTTYTAIVEYTNPNGTTFSIENDITVDLEGPLPVQTPQTVPICTLGPLPYTVNVNQNSYILNGATPSDYDITYFTDFNAADNDLTASSFYIPNPNAFLLTVAPPFIVYARIFDTNTGCYNVRSFNITGAAPGGTFSYAQPNYCNTLLTTAPVVPSGLSSGGTYAADPATTDLIINAATGEVTPNGSVPATYTVRYTLPASGACPAYTTTAPITIVACSCDVAVTSPPACLGQNATVTAVPVNTTVTYVYVWTVPAAYTDPNPGNVATFQTIVPGTYTVYITDPITSCVSATMSTVVSFVTPPNAGFGASKPICETDFTPINLFSLLTGTPQSGGTWTATGTGTGGTLVGNIYTPASASTTRTFEYKVTGTSPCSDATSVITIIKEPQPNAGSNNSISVCDNNLTPINLFSVLGGSPQTGGTWAATGTGTGGTLVGGIYTPAIGPSTRTFEYTIIGTVPCITAKSTVTVTIVPKADAGGDGAATICETNTNPINLFNLLTGTPQTGGTWTATGTGTGGTLVGNIYTPAGATTRTFEYKVTGTPPCLDDTSVVTIDVFVQPDAGTGTSIAVCDNNLNPITLFSLLTGTPQTGGTWAATGTGTGGTLVGGIYTPAIGPLTRTFEYTIIGTVPCITAKSTVTVTIVPKADAGIDRSTTICETDTNPINLFNLLNGTPQTGGTWTTTGTGGTLFGNIYTPVVGSTTRTFEYKVTGTSPCADDTSIVTINVLVQPNAGVDGSIPICDNNLTPINLFSVLGGSPQTGGTWVATGTGTGGTLVGDIYTPAIGATTRTFEYTITGTAPCVTDKSTVTVNITPKADAGIDRSTTICENDTAPINLFNLLTGTPQLGGTWTATGTGTGGTLVGGIYTPAIGATNRTFEYKVTGTPPCGDDTSIVSINILPLPGASLTGNNQVCLTTLPKPQITFTGFGGTPPYTFTYNINSGFPQTTQSSSTSDIAVIDVDTNIDGTFRYNLLSVESATTPACSNPQNDFVIVTVLPLPTATIETSATQACLNTTSPQITFKGFNGTAPYTFEYKINGVLNTKTTAIGSNTVSIVVPNTAGVYSYELISVSSTTSPSCNNILSGPNRIISVTIVPLPTLTLNFGSIATPVVCIGNPIAPIVYTIGGSATGATVVGTLPNGITGVFTGPNTFTISGTPSQSSNTPYTFTVETSGGCLPKATLNGSITVNPAATIVLSSGNNNQSVCLQTQAITNMIYSFANGATSAYISSGSLPAGINGVQVGNTFIISGTPTTFGTFNFEISTTGGCPSTPINGSITVKPKVSILLTSTATTTNQSRCLTDSILPITYIVGDGATSAQATGLPPGVIQNFNSTTGVLTISGPVTSLGIYNYTVSTFGGCSIATLGGTITVTPSATIQLSSPVGTDAQSICIFEPMNDIIYFLGNGALSASIILGEIPKGITAVTDTATNSFILSGTPTESGIFNFTIRTINGCLYDEITGSIRVNALPLFALESLGYVCVDVAGTPTTQVDIYTNLNTSQYSFVWSDANGVLTPPETNNFLIAKKPGDYSVEATFLATGCVGTASTTIVPSLPPSAATAASPSFFAENQLITVNVTPPGVYEYQVDNGAFQDSNLFYGLTPGTHTIYVQDKFSCGFTTTTIHIVDFPKYFTPNGDGYNDVWNISEIANQPNSRIFIYDRYGKLLKEISPGTSGWDGTFNAVPLPADDYWFKVFYKEDGVEKEFKSHISLKR